GAIEHCGANEGSGETEQEKETELLNPFTGFTFTAAMELWPAVRGLGVGGEGINENSGTDAKLAVTASSACSVTLQAPFPRQPAPLQPLKTEPKSEVAVRTILVPLAKSFAHLRVQDPPGLSLTDPPP